jgi:phosphoribosyl 1,2-cyclic phosphodiesterase
MRVKICGARGSVPSPGPDNVNYGGNTSCVDVELSDGTRLILDAGTGIRNLPSDLGSDGEPVHILLTHLHLDHIQGLLFFAPLFEPRAEITIWGPSAPGPSLKQRLGRYLSAPLTPIDIRELPAHVDFRNCPVSAWDIGPAHIRAEAVTHRGPTLGFRIEEDGASLCYLPDHEPALLASLDELEPEWISGYSLASGASMLLHDSQYTDIEYPAHYGWGHAAVSHALEFAARCDADQMLLFHHDPQHGDDQLDSVLEDALVRWRDLGRDERALAMAHEGDELSVGVQSGAPDTAA